MRLERFTMRPTGSAGALAMLLVLVGATGCSGEAGGSADVASAVEDAVVDANVDTAAGADASADAAAGVVQVGAADFDCMLGWEKVRGFRLKRLGGDVAASLAVANNPDGGVYPAGTVIQLVPTEAMVKREAGFSPATQDWEFFFLKVSATGTEIVDRGTTEVKNGFGGNCYGCHSAADSKWDLVCEQDHGCAKLPIGRDVIRAIQQADPRCASGSGG